MKIKLSRIILPPHNQNKRSDRDVKRAAKRIREGEYSPKCPILVQKQGQYYVLIKGYNTVLAYEQLGFDEIEAEVI